jgi:hypothetical protein
VEYLDGHVAEPAYVEHHVSAARSERSAVQGDRVVRREAGIGQRCGLYDVQVAQRQHRRARRDDVLGHAAVPGQADSVERGMASIVVSEQAFGATAASEDAAGRHGLVPGEAGDAGA